MKRSTFLASIAALILAPFGVKAFRKKESTYILADALKRSKPVVIHHRPTSYINESFQFDMNGKQILAIHNPNSVDDWTYYEWDDEKDAYVTSPRTSTTLNL